MFITSVVQWQNVGLFKLEAWVRFLPLSIADDTQQRAIIYDRNQIKRIIEQYNELN